MATYAAYRHVELDKVGCGKRSIMKPPGGDSHDIFGADFHGTPSHHRVLKPPGGGTSQLFATTPEEPNKPRVPQTKVDGGASQNTAANGVEALNGKNGNVSVSESDRKHPESSDRKRSDLEYASSVQSSALSAEIKNINFQDEKRQKDGNPVTGEGYDTPDTQPTGPARTRVPPGGYSSGLW